MRFRIVAYKNNSEAVISDLYGTSTEALDECKRLAMANPNIQYEILVVYREVIYVQPTNGQLVVKGINGK